MKGTGFCGINCHNCPNYKATIEDNPQERTRLAQEWNAKHGTAYKASQMVCLGCKSDRHFAYCDECEIRECNQRRNLKNCGGCLEFPCDIGREFWKTMPDEYENLRKIHRLLFKEVMETDSDFDEGEGEGFRGISKRGVFSYQEQEERNHQEHAINKPIKKKAVPVPRKTNTVKKRTKDEQDD
jgi:hypothetical protein